MSNTAALALVVASMSAGFAGYIYVSKWAHQISVEIVTGIAHTAPVPLPNEWRWRVLYGRWIYLPISIVGFSTGITAVNITTADLASDAGVKVVAYFVAAMSALIAVNWLVYGIMEFIHLRSILRDSSRSPK